MPGGIGLTPGVGYVVKVACGMEPGFYIVPEILNLPKFRQQFKDEIRWDQLKPWWGFGGIRIEDDIRITPEAPEVLSHATPKSPDDISRLVGTD